MLFLVSIYFAYVSRPVYAHPLESVKVSPKNYDAPSSKHGNRRLATTTNLPAIDNVTNEKEYLRSTGLRQETSRDNC